VRLSPFSDFSTGITLSNPRLSIIPAGAVTDRSLEPRDLQVLCLLGRHTDKAGWCIRSQVKMAREIACSRGSLQNSLDRLSEAGWVQKKRMDTEVEEAGKRPSRSYAYRVLLDRDDYAFENATRDAEGESDESYAETASEEGGCQPVGTPPVLTEGVPTDQHPGANACDGTGANAYVGTKNAPLERPLIERERDARATKDRKARFLVTFEARWPSAAVDDRQRTAYAAGELSEAEEEAALAGIAPFLDLQKKLGRKTTIAAWNYLEQKRWVLLETQKAEGVATSTVFARDSVEARALIALHDLAGAGEGFRKIYVRAEGVSYRKPMTPQLSAMAQMPPSAEWITLSRNQAGAWDRLIDGAVTINVWKHLKEGDRAPWPWPPAVDGKLYTAETGPPEALMTDQDAENFT